MTKDWRSIFGNLTNWGTFGVTKGRQLQLIHQKRSRKQVAATCLLLLSTEIRARERLRRRPLLPPHPLHCLLRTGLLAAQDRSGRKYWPLLCLLDRYGWHQVLSSHLPRSIRPAFPRRKVLLDQLLRINRDRTLLACLLSDKNIWLRLHGSLLHICHAGLLSQDREQRQRDRCQGEVRRQIDQGGVQASAFPASRRRKDLHHSPCDHVLSVLDHGKVRDGKCRFIDEQ